jgi:hypothetical protein
VLDAPVTLRDKLIQSVYLAGKITGTAWRDEILPSWSSRRPNDGDWRTAIGCVPLPDGRSLDYAGPYWRDIYGRHGSWRSVRDYPHAYVTDLEDRGDLAIEIKFALARADLLFAWIDTPDCYGTIAEIGYFRAWHDGVAFGQQEDRKTTIVIASPRPMADLWLAHSMADITILAASPAEAWKQLWRGTWTPLQSAYQSGDTYDASEHSAPENVPAAPKTSTIWQNGSLCADTGPLAGIETIEALEAAVAAFDDCNLKRTATNTVFADGNPTAPVMMIGEAPVASADCAGAGAIWWCLVSISPCQHCQCSTRHSCCVRRSAKRKLISTSRRCRSGLEL